MNGHTPASSVQSSTHLAPIIEQLTSQLLRGETVDVETLIQQHPEYADQLRELLPMVGALRNWAAVGLMSGENLRSSEVPLDSVPLQSSVLGDFRILRQLGRGGMGIVYQAEQISLARTVAIKILPLAAMLDPRQLQRFKNEAQAAASLEHPHIVNVFFVGCERGVHFYAMRYVDGQSLAEVLAGVRPVETKTPLPNSPDQDTRPLAALTTRYMTDRRAYYRTVAQLGIQAAQALDYAHRMAIVHRDIKPSNLLLDHHGHLWVTDFGLAIVLGNDHLSMTGDVVGTLRYMSPEQAVGKSTILDHRTDIYSLGITLYELLTLEPAYPEHDRQALLRRIVHDEPVPPRKINGAIPEDLQTIILKAIAKLPADRYASARALIDDLQRFLDQRPIEARPLGRLARTWRWCRRSPAFAGLTAAVILLLLCVSVTAVTFAYRENAHRAQAEARTDEAEWQQYLSDMHSAMAAWEQSDVGRTRELLERHRPKPGETDRRGFEWNYLWRQCQDDRLKVTIDEQLYARCLAYSHDGTMLATGSNGTSGTGNDGRVRIWNPLNGHLIHEFKVRPWVVQIAFSPDDRILASADNHGKIVLQNVSDADPWHSLSGHQGVISGILFSADGQQLASSGNDLTIRVWDVATGKELRLIRLETPELSSILPPWTDNQLWCASLDGRLRKFDTKSGRELKSIQRDELTKMRSMACVSWDGKIGATWGKDGIIRLFETEAGRDLGILGPHGAAIRWGVFSHNHDYLATSDARGKVVVWDLAQRMAHAVLRGHSGPVWPIEFSPDGGYLCTNGEDKQLRIWDLTRDPPATEVCQGHQSIVPCLAFSPDGRMVASGGTEATGGLVKLWDVSTGQFLFQLAGHTYWIWSLSFSPDGTELATTGGDGTLRMWDLQARQLTKTIEPEEKIHSHWVRYSRDGNELITSEPHGILRVWNRQTGKEVRRAQVGQSWPWHPTLSPDGRIVVAGVDQSIVLLDFDTFKTLRRFPNAPFYGTSLAASPDGQTVAAFNYGKSVHLFSMDGTSLGTWENAADVHSLDFSPDGSTLVIGDDKHKVRIWDVKRRQVRVSFQGHDAWVDMVRFSPDGKTIASSSDDGTIRLWRSALPN